VLLLFIITQPIRIKSSRTDPILDRMIGETYVNCHISVESWRGNKAGFSFRSWFHVVNDPQISIPSRSGVNVNAFQIQTFRVPLKTIGIVQQTFAVAGITSIKLHTNACSLMQLTWPQAQLAKFARVIQSIPSTSHAVGVDCKCIHVPRLCSRYLILCNPECSDFYNSAIIGLLFRIPESSDSF